MKDKIEKYILDIEELLASSTAEVGGLRGAQAASLILEEELREAIESGDVIGQAKGILMERESVSADGALDMLKAISQSANIKLHDVALFVVARQQGLLGYGPGSA